MPAPLLLVVEPDFETREQLQHELGEAGFAVQTSPTLVAALAQARARVPDLMLVDLRGTDGLGLVDRLREHPATSGISVALLAADGDQVTVAAAFARGVELLAKPIGVKEIVTRLRRHLLRPEASERLGVGHRERSGSLVALPLAEVVRSLAGRTATLTFRSAAGEQARVWLSEGRVVDAQAGRHSGERAFHRAMTFAEGTWHLDETPHERPAAIGRETAALLDEGTRRLDKWKRLVAEAGGLEALFGVDFVVLAFRLGDIPDEVNLILRLLDGRRPIRQVLDESPFAETDTLAAVLNLQSEGIVRSLGGRPSAAPAVVSAPPPIVSAPPPIVSAPPPIVSAPPPVVSTPPPIVSAPPPVVSAPPPVVSAPPPVVSAPPPIVSTPPPVVSAPPPIVSAPPPIVSAPPPVVSAPPPVVSTPPPIVSAPPPIVAEAPSAPAVEATPSGERAATEAPATAEPSPAAVTPVASAPALPEPESEPGPEAPSVPLGRNGKPLKGAALARVLERQRLEKQKAAARSEAAAPVPEAPAVEAEAPPIEAPARPEPIPPAEAQPEAPAPAGGGLVGLLTSEGPAAAPENDARDLIPVVRFPGRRGVRKDRLEQESTEALAVASARGEEPKALEEEVLAPGERPTPDLIAAVAKSEQAAEEPAPITAPQPQTGAAPEQPAATASPSAEAEAKPAPSDATPRSAETTTPAPETPAAPIAAALPRGAGVPHPATEPAQAIAVAPPAERAQARATSEEHDEDLEQYLKEHHRSRAPAVTAIIAIVLVVGAAVFGLMRYRAKSTVTPTPAPVVAKRSPAPSSVAAPAPAPITPKTVATVPAIAPTATAPTATAPTATAPTATAPTATAPTTTAPTATAPTTTAPTATAPTTTAPTATAPPTVAPKAVAITPTSNPAPTPPAVKPLPAPKTPTTAVAVRPSKSAPSKPEAKTAPKTTEKTPPPAKVATAPAATSSAAAGHANDERFQKLFRAGTTENKENRFASAERKLRAALKLKEDAAAERELGWALYNRGKTQQAEVALFKATKLNDRDADTYMYLGMVLYDLDRKPAAAKAYRRFLALEPKNSPRAKEIQAVLQNLEQ